MDVRTRFAPSPTGALHLGGARTALFNWLFARHSQGHFILRLEDTDRRRSLAEHSQQIMAALDWMGLDWDGEVIYQAQRDEQHRALIQTLLDGGHAYYCDCPPERLAQLREEQQASGLKPRYDRHCRDRDLSASENTVVRFRTPEHGEVVVTDTLKGSVTFANEELDDLVIARRDGSVTYHLAVVADDLDAEITHVIRGDDHFNNTPRQIHIIEALGAVTPNYTHLPMILDEQGRKMSKRAQAADVMNYREEGFLPSALINALARLGWAHGDEELFSKEELIELFDLGGLNPAASRIDPKKLSWVNQQQMTRVAWEELEAEFHWHCERLDLPTDTLDSEQRAALLNIQRQRCRNTSDLADQSRWLLLDDPGVDEKARTKVLTKEALERLQDLSTDLEAVAWDRDSIHTLMQQKTEALQIKPGLIAQPLRVAVTGGPVSPSIEDTLILLGREKALSRLRKVIAAES